MLNLYFGNIDGAILSGNDYFDSVTPNEIIETEIGKKVIKSMLPLLYDSSILLDIACLVDNSIMYYDLGLN